MQPHYCIELVLLPCPIFTNEVHSKIFTTQLTVFVQTLSKWQFDIKQTRRSLVKRMQTMMPAAAVSAKSSIPHVGSETWLISTAEMLCV